MICLELTGVNKCISASKNVPCFCTLSFPSLCQISPVFLDSSSLGTPFRTAWCWCSSCEVLGRSWGLIWMQMCPHWVCSKRACSMWETAWDKSRICWSNCCLSPSAIQVCHLDKRWASLCHVYDIFFLVKITAEVDFILLVIMMINLTSHSPSLSDKNHAWWPPYQCRHQQR